MILQPLNDMLIDVVVALLRRLCRDRAPDVQKPVYSDNDRYYGG